jgi:RHS repeat-associated protein
MLTEDENDRDEVGCYPDSPTSYTSEVGEKFTGQIREPVDLDYFIARYYSAGQGRFTGPDLPFADQWADDPQSWNLYAYVRNSPLFLIDPSGRGTVCWSGSIDWETRNVPAGCTVVPDLEVDAGGQWLQGCPAMYVDGVYLGSCDGTFVPPLGEEWDIAAAYLKGVAEVFARMLYDYKDPLGGSYLLEAAAASPFGKFGKTFKWARAARTADRTIDANKLNHIFGQSKHNLGPLIEAVGSREAVFMAVEDAVQVAARRQGLTDLFEEVGVEIAGRRVLVDGRVIDGVARIGTFYIP